jgi:hypothetical protein
MALLSVSMVILSILLFVIGVVLQQGNMIQRELWLLRRDRKPECQRTQSGQESDRDTSQDRGRR